MRRSESTLRECRLRLAAAGLPAPVVGPAAGAGEASLMDAEGRLHGLAGERVVLGRDSAAVDLALLHDSVSRRHAELRREAGGWTLRDLGSTNGTFVEGQRVVGCWALCDRQLFSLGNVSLVFLAATSAPRTSRLLAALAPPGDLVISRAGKVVLDGVELRFNKVELRAIVVLAERALAELGGAEATRGFVRSAELAPAASETRGLVNRLRRELRRAGGEELLEASDRLGYRLRVIPVLGD